MTNTPLQEWFNIRLQKKLENSTLIYSTAASNQIMFVRDDLAYVVGAKVDIISTHRSKSVELPVYSISRPDLGFRLILRNNFHDWCGSIISETPIPKSCLKGFSLKADGGFYEGFPKDLIFDSYTEESRKFSFCIGGKYRLYTLIFNIMTGLKNPEDD